ncbi:hypothetical protein D3C86_1455300 [compost metagenome]
MVTRCQVVGVSHIELVDDFILTQLKRLTRFRHQRSHELVRRTRFTDCAEALFPELTNGSHLQHKRRVLDGTTVSRLSILQRRVERCICWSGDLITQIRNVRSGHHRLIGLLRTGCISIGDVDCNLDVVLIRTNVVH